jgi:hypothetical protein
MKNKASILKSEILRDMQKLENLFEKLAVSNTKFEEQKEYAFLVESAFYVNQIYTGFERMFRNIADSFENSFDEKSWHKSLLDRMTLDIENIRPPVISESNYRFLDEIRAFRHFFRHTYDFDLDKEKFSIVTSSAMELRKTYKTDIERFLQFIDELLKREKT